MYLKWTASEDSPGSHVDRVRNEKNKGKKEKEGKN